MSPLAAIRSVYGNYANFSGRAPRSEYWWFILAYLMTVYLMGLSTGIDLAAVVLMVVYVGSIVPALAVTVRRLHDTGRSGWWMLIALIPLALLVMVALPGDAQANKYGAPHGMEPADTSPTTATAHTNG